MRNVPARATKFVGLSDRDHPSKLSPYECPDLRNVEFYGDTFGKRRGVLRIGTAFGYLRDAALRLDGVNDYWSAAHVTVYDVTGNNRAHIGIGCLMRKREPFITATAASGDRTLLSKGWDNASNNFVFRLYYDVSLNTGAGGWTMEVRDTTGPSTKTFTVNDGTAAQLDPLGLYRYIEFGWFSSSGYVLKVYSADGTLIGASAAQTVVWNNTTSPIYVGVAQIASDTPDDGTLHTTPDFMSATVAELRFSVFSSVTYPTGSPISEVVSLAQGRPSIVARELGSTVEILPAFLAGYWKFNDGQGARAVDWSGNGNLFYAATAGPTWESDTTKVIGSSGLHFHGKSGFVHIQHSQANVNALFNPTNLSRKWTIAHEFVPETISNGTTTVVPDQTVLWMGVVAATPAPLGIRIVSDAIEVKFNSPGAVLKTITVAGLSVKTTMANKRCRVVVFHSDIGVSDQLDVRVYVEGVAQFFGGGTTWATGAVPTPSPNWFIGRTLTSAAFPYAYGTAGAQGPMLGIIDDFYVVQDTSAGGPGGAGAPWNPTNVVFGAQNQAQLFNELGQVPNGPVGSNIIQFYLKMNEGSGSFLSVEGAWASSSAYLYPQIDEGVYWDYGIVEPFQPVPGRLIFDSRIFTAQKQAVPDRTVLVVAGCTLHSVNLTTGTVKVLAGGLDKPGLCTAAQYGSVVFIASRNGKRNIRFDGQSTALNGIERPAPALSGLVVSGGTGTFAAGTYQVYYTFTNPGANLESNPSPPFSVTLTALDKITALNVPTSPDPQVKGRRIYMTAVLGLPGDTAYLVAEILDNTTTAPVLSITNVLTTSTKMEYLLNSESPAGGVVAIFRSYLFVGGNQTFPTRVWFSSPFQQGAFNKDVDFEDLDSDIGDPVVALVPRADVLTAFGHDSRWDLWLTGLDLDPVDKRPTSKIVGCVSPQAVVEYNGEHIFMGERNVYRSSGPGEVSISSPSKPQTTFDLSIQGSVDTLLRETVQPSAWEGISAGMHRAKDQLYVAVPLKDTAWGALGHNSDLLVHDFIRKTWSRYDIEVDCLGEVEDEQDAPWIYGISGGFLCKLDTGTVDGVAASMTIAATAAGGLVVAGSGTPLTGLDLRGVPVWIWTADVAANIGRTVVVRHTSSQVFLRELPATYGPVNYTPQIGDKFKCGPAVYWGDFIVSGGRQIFPKRMKWATFITREVVDKPTLVVFFSPEDLNRGAPTFANASVGTRLLESGTVIRIPAQGQARAFRIRVGVGVDTGATLILAAIHHNPPVPSSESLELVEYQLDYVETDAR